MPRMSPGRAMAPARFVRVIPKRSSCSQGSLTRSSDRGDRPDARPTAVLTFDCRTPELVLRRRMIEPLKLAAGHDRQHVTRRIG